MAKQQDKALKIYHMIGFIPEDSKQPLVLFWSKGCYVYIAESNPNAFFHVEGFLLPLCVFVLHTVSEQKLDGESSGEKPGLSFIND